MFVSLEGLDGAGKTTQARRLAGRLRAAGHEVVECREPGGTPLGERVRGLLLDRDDVPIGGRAEALLFAAARAQIVDDVIRPALARGAWVVADRFLDSSVAYQGGGRRLGLEAVRALSRFAAGDTLPGRTVLLVGARRLEGPPDRIEAEDGAFHDRIARAYEHVARSEPARVRVVDASGDEDAVAARVWAAVHDG